MRRATVDRGPWTGPDPEHRRPPGRAARLLALLVLPALLVLAGCGGGTGEDGETGGAAVAGDGAGLLAGRNLLLITVDTLRADRLGAYGDARAQTPHLDSLADGGVRFAEVYSPTPLTLPSHTVMFTGRHPFATGVRVNGIHYVDEAERTLAEGFRDAGYDTGAVVAAYVMVSKFGLDQGFDLYDDSLAMDDVYRFYAEIPADEVVERFRRWLDRRADPGKPFFAWLHMYDPHQPYAPPAPWGERFADDPYRGEIAFVDEQVGRVRDLLAERSLADDTALVVTSDHGEGFGEHGEWGHGLLAYDETLRVPLIVHAPELPAGRVVEQRVSLYDLAPTLAELFALDLDGGAGATDRPGRSLVPALLDHGKLPPADVYFEALAGREKGWAPITGLVGSGEHDAMKLIDVPRPELYDLARDPGEQHNLLSPGARPAAADGERAASPRRSYRELERRLEELLSAGERENTREMSAEDRQALAALGYLGGGGAVAAGEPGIDPKRAIEVENRARQIRTLAGDDRADQAAAELRRLRADHPDVEVPDFYELDFHIARARGDREAAVAALERGVERFPDFQSLRLRLATYLEETGRYEDAERQARILLELDPRDSQAVSLLGLAAEDRGDAVAARARFEEALVLEPRSVPLRAKVAELALRTGDAGRARGLYDELLAEGVLDDQPNQLARSALLDAALGNLDRAVVTLRRVVAREDAAAHRLSLAMLLLQQGHRDEALLELEQALAAEGRPLEPAQRAMAEQALRQLRAAG